MGKKILVLGTGAQGSTVAQRMDEEPNVDETNLCRRRPQGSRRAGEDTEEGKGHIR